MSDAADLTAHRRLVATLSARVSQVRLRIEAARERSRRAAANVTLIGVTKTHGVDVVRAAIDAGLTDLGENRVQEAIEKIDVLRHEKVAATWHLIGHLQTNKARVAIDRFDILHVIDSMRLASALSERAEHPVRVLMEVNVSGEASKYGFSADEAMAAAERVGALPHLELIGLMTVAPMADAPEDVRPVFRRLAGLGVALGLTELSMGMTGDFEVAVEEGATMVRVGRAIFGTRGTDQ